MTTEPDEQQSTDEQHRQTHGCTHGVAHCDGFDTMLMYDDVYWDAQESHARANEELIADGGEIVVSYDDSGLADDLNSDQIDENAG